MPDALARTAAHAHPGTVLDRVAGFDVVECGPCGFRHVVPLPSEDELREVYRHEYYTRTKPDYLERVRADEDWWRATWGERYAVFERLLPIGRRRILDVGSGPGSFLALGLERGWEVLGVEPSERAAAGARERGVPVVEAFLTPALARELGTFDVVHLSEVLEHLPEPRAMLALAHGLLAPGGLACVSVPNDYNPLQRALRAARGFAPWWVAPPHHLNYFDFASLARLLERTGFDVVRREASFPMELFLLMGEDYVGNDALGRACHAKRRSFEAGLRAAGLEGLQRELYGKLAELGLGRLAVVTARRR